MGAIPLSAAVAFLLVLPASVGAPQASTGVLRVEQGGGFSFSHSHSNDVHVRYRFRYPHRAGFR